MKNFYLHICLLFAFCGMRGQQDAQYSLYQFSQMVINPAYAGARDHLSIVASIRDQWTGFDGAPKTSYLSMHAPILNDKLGVGLTVISDKMGPRNTFGAYGNIAYILRLTNKMKLSFGVNAGYNRYQFNFSQLTFNTPSEVPLSFSQNQSTAVLDINSGVYLKANGFFVGLSATHMNAPRVYDYAKSSGSNYIYGLGVHLFLTAGKSWIVNDNLIIAPTLMIKAASGAGTLDLNANVFIYKRLWLGAYYRGGYGPGLLMQWYVTSAFKVGYSFDTGAADTRRLGGSHEVMISYDLIRSKSKMINPRFL